MLLVVSLFTVKNREAKEFLIRSLRPGGAWQSTARRIAPQIIDIEILERVEDGAGAVCLCLDLWKSIEAYYCACHTPKVQDLFLARRQLADSSFELGTFTLAPPPGETIEIASTSLN